MRLRILIKIKFNVKVVFKVYKQLFADVLQIGVLKNFANFTEKHLC